MKTQALLSVICIATMASCSSWQAANAQFADDTYVTSARIAPEPQVQQQQPVQQQAQSEEQEDWRFDEEGLMMQQEFADETMQQPTVINNYYGSVYTDDWGNSHILPPHSAWSVSVGWTWGGPYWGWNYRPYYSYWRPSYSWGWDYAWGWNTSYYWGYPYSPGYWYPDYYYPAHHHHRPSSYRPVTYGPRPGRQGVHARPTTSRPHQATAVRPSSSQTRDAYVRTGQRPTQQPSTRPSSSSTRPTQPTMRNGGVQQGTQQRLSRPQMNNTTPQQQQRQQGVNTPSTRPAAPSTRPTQPTMRSGSVQQGTSQRPSQPRMNNTAPQQRQQGVTTPSARPSSPANTNRGTSSGFSSGRSSQPANVGSPQRSYSQPAQRSSSGGSSMRSGGGAPSSSGGASRPSSSSSSRGGGGSYRR